MRKRKLVVANVAAFGLALIGLSTCSCSGGDGGADTQTPQQACAALVGATIGEAKLTSATLVAPSGAAGEHCKVTGELHTTLKFVAKLPTTWNKKLLYTGGGGWDGEIADFQLSPSGATGGYVTVASNGGHSDPTGAVFLNNPQVQKDFGYLQIHSVLEVVRQVVRQRYGTDAEKYYFEGCSNGGREALIQATRYPADFDGIVVRAPAYSFTELVLAFNNNMKHQKATAGGAVTAAKASTIATAVLKSCDALDGVADGIVSNIDKCAFDPGSLLCAAAENDTCLTTEQLSTVKAIYAEFKVNGNPVYPGWGPGGEDLGWPMWLIGDSMMPALQLFFGESLIRYWLVNDPNFNSLTFDPSSYLQQLADAAKTLDASFDLKAFFARQGKMILVHGTSDWAISYKGSIKYWNNVAAAVGSAAARDASMEFFLQPGVQHCFGGAGPDTVDLLGAVDGWVTRGQRPSAANLVSKKYDMGGSVTMERPLCPYPQYPRYNGTGDRKVAASYTCTSP
ncbi:MAG TPA: tannase/feruloyl esterase family alpha/beta hydrolase [Pseudomonadota bacterium]|nr:tannase/feruloyl esterase family alpha/beta hydrolase [Pseudomonadota bacterium]